MSNNRQGWGFPLNIRKAHYFNNSIVSLCGKMMFTGTLEDFNHDSKDNCKDCMRRRKKLQPEE